MANYNIELNRWNGSAYDQLLPKNTISGSGSPTTSTVGIVGQFYIDTSTNPKEVWQCLNDSGGVYSWTKNYSAEEILSDTTAAAINALIGSTPETPNDAFSALTNILSGRVKIETGYYTGTGTYGTANKNSLTFDFVPKFIAICYESTSDTGYNSGFIVCGAGGKGGGSSLANGLVSSVTSTTVYWYSTSSAQVQLNTSGFTYKYVAVG